MMEREGKEEKLMNDQKQKVYFAPAIVLEMELETRAGSSISSTLDEFFEGDE